jgi:hypothetical protein
MSSELVGSNVISGDSFGCSVAISGRTAIVGAEGLASFAGGVYVFTETSSGWDQTATLTGSDTVSGDNFGISVAVSGDIAVVGAWGHSSYAGRAYVFTKTATGWKQAAELKGSDTVAGDYFGASVAIAGTTAVVGAWGHASSAGRAYIFSDTRTGWKQTAELKGSDTVTGDYFGASVAISGMTVAVGAWGHAGYAGRTYIFSKSRSAWRQSAELQGYDTIAGDRFGISVAVSGGIAAVGALGRGRLPGRVYIFAKTKAGWDQTAEVGGYDTVAGDWFGRSVAASGNIVVVGALDGGHKGGRAYVFTSTRAGWKQLLELKGTPHSGSAHFGSSVAVSEGKGLVGAPDQAVVSGRAFVFDV